MTPILTIAIPTYNRADILNETLKTLLSDPACDENVEIIVSDNASTDNTKAVVMQYDRVKYFCNSTNIGFGNFTVAMQYGTGKYIRLMNDTAKLNEGMLRKMIDEIRSCDSNKMNLYFVNGLIDIKQGTLLVNDKNEFVDKMSYFITWVVNFGMWRDDFMKINEPNRFLDTLMQHVDWAMIMASNGKHTEIIVDSWVNIVETKKKGSYDIFDTFITKYLSILKYHKISYKTFYIEKYRLLKHFVLNWHFTLKNDRDFAFDTSGKKVIFKRYWYEIYFWPLFIKNSIKR